MQKTFTLPFGARLVIQPGAAGRSVQLTYHPEASCLTPAAGILIPNDLAGEICQAIEAVATVNEERQAPTDQVPHLVPSPWPASGDRLGTAT